MGSWLFDIIRSILFLIDGIVYRLVDAVYSLFMEIANTTIFTNDIIDLFSKKVYALIGIFMLFKVSFSVLTYIVNPDEFNDKNKGMSKLITNIVISLALLIGVPFIFKEAMDLQRIILKDNVIPAIFSTDESNLGEIDFFGPQLAYNTFRNFYTPAGENLNTLLKSDVNEKDNNGEYTHEYTFIVSTVVGVVVVLLLVTFCFDIALRSIKIGFLRMLAPIPILARIDPKKGNEVFNKWTKTCITTYLDLFLRLISIYFAIFIISMITKVKTVDAVTGNTVEVSGLTVVFIILGALMFAKQIPKLIEDLTGIKLDGVFTINPLKKLEEVPIAGKPLSSVTRFAGRSAATLGGIGVGLAASGIDDLTGNRISKMGKSAKEWTSGIRNNAQAGMNEFLKDHANLQRAATKFQSITNDAQRTLYGALGGIPGTSGLLTGAADKFDKQIKEYDDLTNNIDTMLKRANGEMIKYEKLEFKDTDGKVIKMSDYKIKKEQLTALRNRDTRGMTDEELREHAESINSLQTYLAMNEKKAEQAYVDAIINETLKDNNGKKVEDAEITARYKNIERTVRTSSDSKVREIDISNAEGMKKGKDKVLAEKATIQNSQEYRQAQERKNAVPKK